MQFVFWLVLVAAMVVAIVDIVTRDDSQIKHMPKVLWLILVILLPLLGVILWFVLGREHTPGAPRVPRIPRPSRPSRPQRSAPTPPVPPARPYDSRTTEQQLADLEREIEQERLRAEARRRQEGGGQASNGSSAGPSAGPSAS